jgi:hypothetical protein
VQIDPPLLQVNPDPARLKFPLEVELTSAHAASAGVQTLAILFSPVA